MSHPAALVLMAGGATACLLAVISLRMVMQSWRSRLEKAANQRIAHLVWRPVDQLGIVLWCVIYLLGSLAVMWALLALDA